MPKGRTVASSSYVMFPDSKQAWLKKIFTDILLVLLAVLDEVQVESRLLLYTIAILLLICFRCLRNKITEK